MTGNLTIEYCINNVDERSRRHLLTSGLEAVETTCLQRCGECYAGPFLVVDGVLVAGDSHDDLLDQVTANGMAQED